MMKVKADFRCDVHQVALRRPELNLNRPNSCLRPDFSNPVFNLYPEFILCLCKGIHVSNDNSSIVVLFEDTIFLVVFGLVHHKSILF